MHHVFEGEEFDLCRFRHKPNSIVLEQAVVNAPSLGHGRGFVVQAASASTPTSDAPRRQSPGEPDAGRSQQLDSFASVLDYPICLRTTAPFLPSTKALSLLWYARDLVNSSTSSLFSSFTTV